MPQSKEDLLQLKGVGKILVQRMQDAGLDSFAKIAQAGEEGLKKIAGINPRNIGSILQQAQQLSKVSHPEQQERKEALQAMLSEAQEKLHTLAEATMARFPEELAGKCGKKLSCDLFRIKDALASMKLEGKKGSRRAAKALGKVQKRVGGVAEDASLKKVRKTLKRARKAVLKALK